MAQSTQPLTASPPGAGPPRFDEDPPVQLDAPAVDPVGLAAVLETAAEWADVPFGADRVLEVASRVSADTPPGRDRAIRAAATAGMKLGLLPVVHDPPSTTYWTSAAKACTGRSFSIRPPTPRKTMKKQNTVLAIALASVLALGCASNDVVVSHQISPATPLHSYATYHLVVTPVAAATRTDWMVEKAIHDDLRAKGYVPVDRGAADLVVDYETDISEGGDADIGHTLDGSMAARSKADRHVAITMRDATSSQQVWRGAAQGEVHPGHLTASLQDALDEILAAVPRRATVATNR